jgi:hypothetical protein
MSERLYRLLLRFYPRPFRERYEEEMLRVFRDRLRDERTLGVWMDVLVDALVSIPQQHLTAIGSQLPFPRSAAQYYAKFLAKTFVPVMAGAMLMGFVSGVLSRSPFVDPFLNQSGWILAVVMAVAVIAAAWTGGRRVRHIRKSYRAEAANDSITVSCAPLGMTPLTVSRSDVTALRLFEPFGLRIHTAHPARDLWVPFRSPDYAAVKLCLSQWGPLKEPSLGRALGKAMLNVGGTRWFFSWCCLLCFAGPLGWTKVLLATTCALNVFRERSVSRIALMLAPAAIVLARHVL